MKELHYGAYYWKLFDYGPVEWPRLSQSLSTKVLIIGGGMSGLLAAYMLHEHQIDFVLVEADEIADGSSLASTGLLQYSNDTMLFQLRQKMSKESADYYYRCCFDAGKKVQQIVANLQHEAGDLQYYTRSSMQYSSAAQDVNKLEQEYEALSSIGLPCELWREAQIAEKFPFSKPCGLITHGDAEINPHMLVLKLAQYLSKKGQQIFERSSVNHYKKLENGRYHAVVNEQYSIDADYIIHAVGYQYEQLQQPQLQLTVKRSYVIVTDPVADLSFWHQKMMLWETARPYLYVRTTADSRIMIGGLDETTNHLNHDQGSISLHSQRLLKELKQLFPDLDPQIAFQWNATFIETKDGLPYIGTDPQDPNLLYILGYGGNGTISSVIGAQWAADYISGIGIMQKLSSILSLSRS
ncbi:oxidoreductase [Paenibacillus montaniterrae]|uniref:Oxidoreductase n=1 Tax=Paenibacillus montaniterrae TaxID=429341 RepID=A0A919YLZ4_9BACL|nr:FAD-dependent oxidoreductase [Paenibacillus montaniterrae]GIP16318.1 oxidoreductase [Paenibacillus montaniterrae]